MIDDVCYNFCLAEVENGSPLSPFFCFGKRQDDEDSQRDDSDRY